jgi:hypothetical protein
MMCSCFLGISYDPSVAVILSIRFACHAGGDFFAPDQWAGDGARYLVFASLPMVFAATPPTSLPEAPNWLLTVVGGGQLVYLGGKGARLHLSKRGTP